MAIIAAAKNIHQLILILYAKLCSHVFIAINDRGVAIIMAIHTSFTKSFEINAVIFATVAPNTLRMPISFVRCSAANAASPNKPRHDIAIAIIANIKMRKIKIQLIYSFTANSITVRGKRKILNRY